ncbi:hypothetical protein L1987_31540 [Smallanthus sonchifolius]|uniref:Uncharacterized protein n=1 Tax=Smallanthus sonchifolius TaxID=185202 RepID=A0ACB9I5V0_9ASTR|nr:hypothetical protein L1987_31540 [Smallanthus sonchifolius]
MSSSLTLISSFFLAVISTASAAEILVGGDIGWRIPAANETDLYTVWASRRRIYIGDTLRFRYKNESVAVVEKWEFYHCNCSRPHSLDNDGNTVITLYSTGPKYFISGDSDRCKLGVNMKVEVSYPGPERFYPPPEIPHASTALSPSPLPSSSDSVASYEAPKSRGKADVTLIFINPKISYLKLSLNPHLLALLSSPVPLCRCKSSVNC